MHEDELLALRSISLSSLALARSRCTSPSSTPSSSPCRSRISLLSWHEQVKEVQRLGNNGEEALRVRLHYSQLANHADVLRREQGRQSAVCCTRLVLYAVVRTGRMEGRVWQVGGMHKKRDPGCF